MKTNKHSCLIHWLWDVRRAALLAAALYAVALVTFLLYDLPAEPLVYLFSVSAVTLFVAAVYHFIRYRQRYRILCALTAQAQVTVAQLPEPENIVEKQLGTLIAEVEREADNTRSQAEHRYRDMMDYYTLWAHQIKTPIAAMHLLLQRDGGADGAVGAELLRIEEYVEMVLSYLRLDSETNDLVIAECALDPVIRAAIRRYAGLFIAKKLYIHYSPTDDTVLTDEKWLSFVIGQLLSNALKYTNTGGITIAVSPEGVLSIADTGIGIASEDLPRVFERGYTGYNGRADHKSTGIGLYLCRRICEMLHHDITISAVPTGGTIVCVSLARKRGILE